MSNTTSNTPTQMQVEAFSFGDPEPALGQNVYDYIGVYSNGRYYEPPVAWGGLTKSLKSNPHHASALTLKRNMLTQLLRPNHSLTREDFGGLAMDFLVLGNCFAERIVSRTNKPLKLRRAMAMYTRAGMQQGVFWRLFDATRIHGEYGGLGGTDRRVDEQIAGDTIYHLMEPDVTQNIYGMPDYFAALQAAWLNEAATLFRRRYYVNGTHAGYILYITDPLQSQGDIDQLKEKMRQSKGPGNFNNLLVYSPNGKEKGLQLIHTAEAAAKDEFLRIKNVSRDDVLAAHRVPPQLLGLVPENAGGFGSPKDAMVSFFELEMRPLMQKFSAMNDWYGERVIEFDEPKWATSIA